MSDLAALYRFDASAVIQAGAGTGKTHSLVTLCLHLLGGAGGKEPLPPARLCAVTFTEKAGAELRGRIRARVDRLAACAPGALESLCAELEPELLATCRGAGVPLPAQAAWRKVRRDLGQAEIGTLHGLCARLLRRNAAAAGLDPDFTVLDEADCSARRREACERAALDALESDDNEGAPAAGAADRLCRELGLRGTGPASAGLSEQLGALLLEVGESGRDPAALVEETAGLSAAGAVEDDAAARSSFEQAAEALRAALRAPGARVANKTGDSALRALALLDQAGFAALRAAPPGGLHAAHPALGPAFDGLKRLGALAEPIGALQGAWAGLLAADASVRACGLARDLALLAGHALRRYREEKARAGGLDFDDLTRLARDLLARDPGVRRAEKQRLGALLVDEFQDTSHAQLELIGWLAEPPDAEGRSPAGSGREGALPVPPGRLALVGDQKQSIYEFRGADLASARAFAARLQLDGAGLFFLRTSRRSVRPLVDFVNLLFRAALGDGGRPFDAPFVPGEDDLEAVRSGPPQGSEPPCAELLDAGALTLDDEAEAVARRIARLLAPDAPERIRERAPGAGGGPEVARPVRGGDVAILLRSFTHVEAFRAALLRQRVPHLVLKGRGFHETREVSDLRALLRLCADQSDRESLAAVLRSPFGPLSDDALVLLARGPGSSLSLKSLGDPLVQAGLAPDDAAVAASLHALLTRLFRDEARLGPATLLEVALAETCYRAALAGGLFGEQAVANVERLLALARSLEQGPLQTSGPLRALLARLDAMEDGRGESEAPVVEERDPHAVRLLTIHAAKGLEFPVAVVPLCALLPASFEAPLVDPDLGLALKVRGADGGWNLGLHGRRVKDRRLERQQAEGRRLFYVAATRARDRLIFSSRSARGGETWRSLLDRISGPAAAAGLLSVTPSQALLAPPPPAQGPAAESLDLTADTGPIPGEAQAAVARVLQRLAPPAEPGTLVAPVTQLADAVACPERYRLLHEVRLEERPRAQAPQGLTAEDDADADELQPGVGDNDELPLPAAERGTLAHRLLEQVSLADLGPKTPLAELKQRLGALLEAQGEDPKSLAPVVDAVAGFLDSEYGRRLSTVGRETPERLLRELPFALQLAPGPGEPPGPRLLLRGQLDALLLDQGRATVLDYKHSAAKGTARYAVQLDAYALAAHQITGGALPVQAGLVFLRSRGAPVSLRPEQDDAARARTRAALLEAARSIAEGRRTGRFGKREPAGCRELGCGFIWRCHPEEAEGRGTG